MPRRLRAIHHTDILDADELRTARAARHDIVHEARDGDDRFVQALGPFTHYERLVSVTRHDDSDERAGNRRADSAPDEPQSTTPDSQPTYVVEQAISYQLPPGGLWRAILNLFFRRSLRNPPPDGTTPVWAPPRPLDARALRVTMLLATIALVIGYHGTLLGQTMTFAAEEFGADEATQGDILSLARVGGVLAIVLGALADRNGRRRMLIISVCGCILTTALGAITPNLLGLALTQSLNRGTWAASLAVMGVIVAEEMPASARAYTLGLLSMATALGAGVALVVLPVADVGTQAWRVLYALPLLAIPLVLHCGRQLPESKRYERPHRNLSLRGHLRVLLLVATAAFLLNLLLGPGPQFQNEFLREERGFSALDLSLFSAITALPGALGILIGGRLAETSGRRKVVAVSATSGGVLVALSYAAGGPPMWLAATLGTVALAAVAPSFTIYYAELFPTSLRGRASGIISMVAMAGSVVGLQVVGRLASAFGMFWPAFAVVAAGPLLMALLVLLRFPETKQRELEELHPEDDLPSPHDRPPDTGPVSRAEPGLS